jgi:hypothetical protein
MRLTKHVLKLEKDMGWSLIRKKLIDCETCPAGLDYGL